MEESNEVASWLERWRAGDEDAAERLIEHLYPLVAKIARAHVLRRDSAEDLVQEILMKTFSRLPQFKGDVPLRHWVSRLAVTTCLDRQRAQKVRPEVRRADLTPHEAEVFDSSWLAGSTPDAGDAIEARDLVDKILGSLPAEERSLILMVDLEGRSLEEVAAVTGWGLSKIKMRLFRVRAQLRKIMHYLEDRS